jgi:methylmalonyl-CoA/ethylmalonyl-CoA epimerase
VLGPGEFAAVLERIASREVDPYAAAEAIMARAVAGAPVVPSPIDHVGIAVKDAPALAALFRDLLGLETGEPEVIGAHRLRFVLAGGATLELVEAVTPEAPVAKFLLKHGDALHHVCFRVRDIDASVQALVARGVRMIDEQPRQGAHGSRIAFIHPASAGGLLVELKQP